jgi:predicted enzyme related to lactoylglutathione lyase
LVAGNPAALPTVPALNSPATTESLPGKFIFTDYFTSDIEATRRFYGELFGWEWRWIGPDRSYGMFYHDDIAVAGVVLHESNDNERAYGRWIFYLSTDDVPKKVEAVSAEGGRVMLEPTVLPARGTLAVVADPEGAPFGLLSSDSGDPADYRAEPGEWLWVSLYSRDVEKASQFYRLLFGYDVTRAEDTADEADLVLSRDGVARGGISPLAAGSASYPTWLGYIRVADVGASVAKALEMGGAILVAPDPALLDGNLAIIADPIGAPIALIHWTYENEAAR